MLPPTVAPGSLAVGWRATFPLFNGSNTASLILPSISCGSDVPVLRPHIPVSNLTTPYRSKAYTVYFVA